MTDKLRVMLRGVSHDACPVTVALAEACPAIGRLIADSALRVKKKRSETFQVGALRVVVSDMRTHLQVAIHFDGAATDDGAYGSIHISYEGTCGGGLTTFISYSSSTADLAAAADREDDVRRFHAKVREGARFEELLAIAGIPFETFLEPLRDVTCGTGPSYGELSDRPGRDLGRKSWYVYANLGETTYGERSEPPLAA